MQNELMAAYQQVLTQFDLSQLQDESGLSGIFLPSAPSSEPLKLMVVGQQAKGWGGAFAAVQNEV